MCAKLGHRVLQKKILTSKNSVHRLLRIIKLTQWQKDFGELCKFGSGRFCEVCTVGTVAKTFESYKNMGQWQTCLLRVLYIWESGKNTIESYEKFAQWQRELYKLGDSDKDFYFLNYVNLGQWNKEC